jgi:lipid-A-disaccharide synthase
MSEESKSSKSVFISAGEQSGDLHGSGLIKELKALFEGVNIKFIGLGGDLMKVEGLNELYHIKDLATVGFTDVIKKYTFFKKVISDCVELIREANPDVVVLIDYPGFNIRLAEELKKYYNGKIIYYISPQLWAWHEKRVHKIKKYADKMLVVFPFELEFYRKFGVNAEYVGHPLTSRIRKYLNENPVKEKTGTTRKVITILPGSRKDEIKHHMPVLIETVNMLKNEFDLEVNISKAPSLGENVFSEFENIKGYNLTGENVYNLILNSDLVLTKAGTSTMECSLIGTPYLIFYKTFPLNYYILKPIVKINNLGIANIISKENIVREFIQKDFTSENLVNEAREILTNESYRNKMKENLRKIWDILGEEDASSNAAKIIKQTARL